MPTRPKVIAFTPAGRRRYLEVLIPYIYRDRIEGTIDEYQLWINTNDQEEAAWCRAVAEESGGFIRAIEGDPEIPVIEGQNGYSIYQFYRECVDTDAVYVRFDDDIVFVERGATRKLVNFRVNNPGYFLVFANTVNNAICSHLHQRLGLLPALEGQLAGYSCLDPVGWNSPEFAEHIHRTFLETYRRKGLDQYKFNRWELYLLERFSINCFAFLGRDFAEFGGVVGHDEEWWLSQCKPEALGRANAICGDALVAHFSFYSQRDHLEQTDLLASYAEISAYECPSDPWTSSIICA